MAIDTRNRRASCLGVGSPVPRVLPNPDGSIIMVDQQFLCYQYVGITEQFIIGEIVAFVLYLMTTETWTASVSKIDSFVANVMKLVTFDVER